MSTNPDVAAALGLASGNRSALAALLAPAPPIVPVDYSIAAPSAGQFHLAPVDPDRVEMLLHNPSDTTFLIGSSPSFGSRSAFPTASGTAGPALGPGAVLPGAIALPPGATATLNPCPTRPIYAWCGVVGKPLTAYAHRLRRPSRRTLAAANPYGQPSLPNTQGALTITYRNIYWTRGDSPVTDVELVYPGWYYQQQQSAGETNAPAPITIAANIEYPIGSGLKYPVTIDGQGSAVIVPGYDKHCDPVRIRLMPGTPFAVDTAVTVASLSDQVLFQRAAYGPLSSQTLSNGAKLIMTVQSPVGTGQQTTFGPVAILGTAEIDNPPAVMLVVDSIGNGDNTSDATDDRNNMGWPGRVLRNLGGIPYFKVGRGGVAGFTIVGNENEDSTASTVRLRRLMSMVRYSHVFDQQGTNDSNSTAWGLSLGKKMSLYGDRPVGFGTLLPRASGSFTTLAGQTALNLNTVATSQKIAAMPNASIVDASRPVSSSKDSGLWLPATPALTVEGVHPSGPGEVLIAADPVVQGQMAAFLARTA